MKLDISSLVTAKTKAETDSVMASAMSTPKKLHATNAAEADMKRWKTSLQFEAMFMGQMMKAMRETVAQSDLVESAPGHDMFNDMLDQEYASTHLKSKQENSLKGLQTVREGKSTGLAAQIYRSLSRQEGLTSSLPIFAKASMPSKSEVKPVNNEPVVKHMPSTLSQLSDKALEPILDKASQLYQVSKNLIKSVIHHESGNRPDIVSPAGAKGLMQLMDTTASDLKVKDVFNPKENVLAGTKYLKSLLEKFNGDEAKALAGYNAGPGHVEKYGTIPPFPETQKYVRDVLKTKMRLDARDALEE